MTSPVPSPSKITPTPTPPPLPAQVTVTSLSSVMTKLQVLPAHPSADPEPLENAPASSGSKPKAASLTNVPGAMGKVQEPSRLSQPRPKGETSTNPSPGPPCRMVREVNSRSGSGTGGPGSMGSTIGGLSPWVPKISSVAIAETVLRLTSSSSRVSVKRMPSGPKPPSWRRARSVLPDAAIQRLKDRRVGESKSTTSSPSSRARI